MSVEQDPWFLVNRFMEFAQRSLPFLGLSLGGSIGLGPDSSEPWVASLGEVSKTGETANHAAGMMMESLRGSIFVLAVGTQRRVQKMELELQRESTRLADIERLLGDMDKFLKGHVR